MEQPTTYRVPGAILTEREHAVPLDHANPAGPTITVFTREVAAPDGVDRPYLVFLQGGPGFEAARPTSPPTGWMKRAIADYRVLLLDQRGTGRSTPVGSEIPGDTPAAQAEYLTHFRADSIVRDAELIRQELGVERWSVLGQSFGGFTSMTYLSIAPEGLREAFITGGLSPIGRPVDDIYGATYRRLIDANRRYFERYPDDRATGPRHPAPARRRGRSAADRRPTDRAALPPARAVARRQRRLRAPPPRHRAAVRVARVPARRRGRRAVQPQPDLRHAPRVVVRRRRRRRAGRRAGSCPTRSRREGCSPPSTSSRGCGRTTAALRSAPRRGRASSPSTTGRASTTPTGCARNEVPVAATIYVNDLYVERDFAEETAAAIRGLRTWQTDEFEHNGLRADGERVLGRLIDLVRGRA